MRLLSLTTKEEAAALGLEILEAQREDIQVEDGRGGYRSATREEQDGKIVARWDSKELRRRGLTMPGQLCFCTAYTS